MQVGEEEEGNDGRGRREKEYNGIKDVGEDDGGLGRMEEDDEGMEDIGNGIAKEDDN